MGLKGRMLTYLQSVIFLLILMISAGDARAQVACSNDFSQITAECITASNKPFSNRSIPLSSELEGRIYFYKTPSGELGKMRIVGVVNNKRECTVFLDAVTYGQRAYVPNSSLSISPSRSNWLHDRLYLDRDGFGALELRRQPTADKKSMVCALGLTKGAEFAFYGMHSTGKVKEEKNILFYGPLVLIFIAIFLIVRGVLEDQDKYKTQEALEEAENTGKGKTQPFFIKVTRPFYKRYFLPLVQGLKSKQKIRNKYRQPLANAGLSKEMSPEEFVALKFFMILGGPFVFLAVRWIMEENWSLSITPVMAVVGFYYPNIWLKGLIAKRAQDTLRAMPFIVDMLALSVEAGLDFMAAIQRVIEKAPPSPLVEEFETLIKETRIGSSRAEGLRQLGWRVNIIEINSFCATLIAADSVGASISPILKQLSAELRVKRSSRAEQQGATAATKILIPMIFFILPAVLVAIFAPMALKMMTGNL